MAFVGGRRVRPGEVFELPDGTKLGVGMVEVKEGAPADKPAAADTKPADAAKAAAAKQKAAQGSGGDTKPADAAAAAAAKAGGGKA